MLDGVTFSGGDPMFNPKEFIPLLREVKQRTGLNIWCYTGYTYEQLLADEERRAALNYIDVLVDGRFVQELYQPTLDFRGSTNQRILTIDHSTAY